ncbi:MAG: GNAT family N-acetyltransferase, partial [Spiribacter salinus]
MGDAFCSTEWYEAWSETFDRPVDLEGASLIPLIRSVRLVGPLRIRVLKAMVNDHTPWLDLPVSDTSPHSSRWVYRALWLARADVLVLPLLRRRRSTQAVLPPGLAVRWQATEQSPLVNCVGSWDAYWQSRGSRTRAEWARAERRLQSDGFMLACHTSEAGLDAALDDAFAIEADSWKGDQGSAIRQDPKLERFYRRVARDWARRGLLRLYFLQDGERRIAFQLCALDGRQLVSLKIGFRRAFARQGPGQALQLMILRELFADPDVERFDMLGPATEHKMKWATGAEQLWTVRCYRPGLRGCVAALRWSVLPALRARLRGPRAPQRVAEAG